MNAHNEQHDPASPVVKQNLTTQPAAAQEAVAHLPRRSIDWLHGLHSANDATRKADAYNRPVPDEQTIPVYAAPVTAAPGIDPHALGLLEVLGAKDFAEASNIVGGLLADASPKGERVSNPDELAFAARGFLSASIMPSAEESTREMRDTYSYWHRRLLRAAGGAMDYEQATDTAADSPKGGSERGHFQDRLADIEGRPRTEREPEDDEEGCLHEFVAFRSDCIHCGKAYVPPQAGDAEVQP